MSNNEGEPVEMTLTVEVRSAGEFHRRLDRSELVFCCSDARKTRLVIAKALRQFLSASINPTSHLGENMIAVEVSPGYATPSEIADEITLALGITPIRTDS